MSGVWTRLPHLSFLSVPVGPDDPDVGPPTQLAVFFRRAA
jgi:hypothetical protein